MKQGPGSEATTTGKRSKGGTQATPKAWAARSKARAAEPQQRAETRPGQRKPRQQAEARPGQQSHNNGQKQGAWAAKATTTGRSKRRSKGGTQATPKAWAARSKARAAEPQQRAETRPGQRKPRQQAEARPGQQSHNNGQKQGAWAANATTTGRSKSY